MDFFGDLAKILETDLAAAGYTLSGGTPRESIVRNYLNVLHRQVPTKAREVLESKTFICPPALSKGYAELKRKAIAGDSMVPHQSRRMADIEFEDLLLNDWGIQHFHLGTSLQGDGYVKATRFLLFARVTDEYLFVLQIYDHNAFTKQELVQILHENWPASIEQFRLKGVVALSRRLTDDDISCLRYGRVNTSVQIGSDIYAPIGGGQMTSGVSLQVQRGLDRIVEYCEHLQKKANELASLRQVPSRKFTLKRIDSEAVVTDLSTETALFSETWFLRNLK